jgi:hypothetical protein|tara:strand:- start:1381 stop:1677 length:297 start_codon:yes stop_codon:yes gene_type:complete
MSESLASAIRSISHGQSGSFFMDDGTSVVTGVEVIAIQCVEDTTFTTLTQTNAKYFGTGAVDEGEAIQDSDTFPQGVTLFGNWSAINLNSGAIIAYIK